MAEKVSSNDKIEKIEETIKKINDFNNNFNTWVKSELVDTLQKYYKSSFLDEMIKALDSIKETYFSGGQKKALIDSLASKKQTLQEEIQLRQGEPAKEDISDDSVPMGTE